MIYYVMIFEVVFDSFSCFKAKFSFMDETWTGEILMKRVSLYVEVR